MIWKQSRRKQPGTLRVHLSVKWDLYKTAAIGTETVSILLNEGLTLETTASESLYGGQFTQSA